MFPNMESIGCFTTTTTDLCRFDERQNSSENSGDNSPSSTAFASSISFPKKSSRRDIQKKVVTVPIKDVEGCRFKGDCTPPADSWAWRKYGQKPIKGSLFPRGYYRCSSTKGCPARKQVERSRSDPNTLVITYSYDHNHPWPTSRNRHNSSTMSNRPNTLISTTTTLLATPVPQIDSINNIISETHGHVGDPLVVPTDELTWLTYTSSSLLTSYNSLGDLDMAKIFPLGKEEDALFADLGELPECSVVFGQPTKGSREEEEQPQQQDLRW